jgi:leucyl/phenylalanyl-tRNA--protein transferase
MFARRSDASKIAFAHLVRQLIEWQFGLIDCQVHTDHLASLGAVDIPRDDFLTLLDRHCDPFETHQGQWQLDDTLVTEW